MKTQKIIFVTLIALVFATGCNKKNDTPSGGTTPLKIRMMDAPGNFTQVNIDITSVVCKVNDGADITLNVIPGIYNLLTFVNGLDTMIASASVPSGTLSQVRLILGPNNSVMVDGNLHPLETPSAMQSGLKLNVHNTLIPGVEYILLLDFDANQSIVLKGNGEYQLKPVIRTVSLASSGSVHGHLSPSVALPAVISIGNGSLSFTTVTDANGYFLVRGVTPGIYTATITPQPPYAPYVLPGLTVTIGMLLELGSIVL